MVHRRFELLGQVFGKLTVTGYAGLEGRGHAIWKCKCSCGKEVTTRGSNLIRGTTKSCGCSRKLTHCSRDHEFNEENTIIGKSGRRTCRKCKELVDKVYYTENKEEIDVYKRDWYQDNKNKIAIKVREYNLKKIFWTPELFDKTLIEQKDKCFICGFDIGIGPRINKDRRAHADHDHDTKKPRAILCGNCNFGLGNFQDNPTLLRMAAEYIEKFK